MEQRRASILGKHRGRISLSATSSPLGENIACKGVLVAEITVRTRVKRREKTETALPSGKSGALSGNQKTMRRIKIKLEEIADVEHCRAAILRAAKGKHRRKRVQRVLADLDHYAEKLSALILDPQAELQAGEFVPVVEGSRKKERELCKPRFFPEHCLHWAVMLVLIPEFEKRLYVYSCSCVKGRGTHYAKNALNRQLKDKRNSKYCLQIDVRKFYESIDKDILVGILAWTIKDKRVVAICRKIITSYPKDGLPLGYYSSAPFANLYLGEADDFIKRQDGVKHMVRYMDDIVILGGNKRLLHRALNNVRAFLDATRGLALKKNWQVYKLPYQKKKGGRVKERRRYIDFVGFKFYRYKTTIRDTIFLPAMRCVRDVAKAKYTAQRAHRYFSYRGYFKHTDSANITRRYIRKRINQKRLKEIIRNETRNQDTSYVAA